MSTVAKVATGYQRTFHGRADQVRQVRADITAYLGDCPVTADTVLVASELATNSVVHSASSGEFFTVRCERHAGYVWAEVEDLGGPWLRKPPGDRPHGLDIIGALAGPENWGAETTSDGDRIVWARLDLPHQDTPAAAVPDHNPGCRPEGAPVTDPGRPHDVTALTAPELDRVRRDLAVSLALSRPGSPARDMITTHMTAVDTERAQRRAAPAATPPGTARHLAAPPEMTQPVSHD